MLSVVARSYQLGVDKQGHSPLPKTTQILRVRALVASQIGYGMTTLEVIAWLNEDQAAMPRVRSMNCAWPTTSAPKKRARGEVLCSRDAHAPPNSIIEVDPKPGLDSKNRLSPVQ